MLIATGKSRKDKKWKNQDISWPQFIEKVKDTHRTVETYAEFKQMSKTKKSDIKDVGGFVAGKLKEGRRLDTNVISRSLLTLDLDFAPNDFWETYDLLFDFEACMYSTHSHSSKSPRLRLIVNLSREVDPDEYQAIARKLAEEIGIDYFDDTTYQPSRLMFWPSTSKDGEYIFEQQTGAPLDADTYLSKYDDWKDTSFWPMSSRVDQLRQKGADKQGDPLLKEGLIGAFCRTYTISEAISTFLSEIYLECATADRYTYVHGSSAAGLVVYEDKFAYSNHGTDPCSMKLCNAFDLVRLHLFGDLDVDVTDGSKKVLPSTKEMFKLVSNDEQTRLLISEENFKDAQEDFKDLISGNLEFTKKLKMNRQGEYEASINNFVMIMKNDANLKDCIGGVDLFTQKVVKSGKMPWDKASYNKGWTDDDDANMRHFIEVRYKGLAGRNNIYDAQRIVHNENSYNPLLDYLEALEWDGVNRLDTLFIDYLGVEDSEYTRAVTSRSLSAAVARVYEPGCKFDYMTVLYGPQGVGKSYILSRLGQQWYTDAIKSFKGKDAHEILQGKWICEVGELSALKRSEVEESKQFISMQVDSYRKAYDRNPKDNPRMCVFFGTTNTPEFLKDNTGNRRYWPLDVSIRNIRKDMFIDLTDSEVDQIWAEAKVRYRAKEPRWLGKELEKVAWGHQENHRLIDYRKEPIVEYLDTKVPEDWYSWDLYQKQEFLEGNTPEVEGTMLRDRIRAREIIDELLYTDIRKVDNFVIQDINNILREIDGWEHKRSVKFPDVKGPRKGFVRVAKGR